jgi:BCD family chlorophyll transporter-like MFS transporter
MGDPIPFGYIQCCLPNISPKLCKSKEIYAILPAMNWRRIAQLSLVHVGVSITVVPVTSTLNRVMIADLGMSALLVSLLIALPYLLSPLQVPVGAWADRNPIGGRYRTPWIVLGGLMAATGSYFTAHAAYWIDANFWPGLLAALVAFAVWGMGVNIASVSYLSLVTDLADENGRSRAVSVMWTAMILSTIFVSLGISRLVDPYTVQALYTAFGAVWFVAIIFVLAGAYGLEPRASAQDAPVHHSADSPAQAMRLLALNPVARRFFVYLVLEPFGAEAMGMPVAATSRLTSIWGVGVLLTLLGSLPLVRRIGKKRSANIGAFVAAAAFGLISLSGWMGLTSLFWGAVFLLGLGGGLMTVSNLSFMLDMTLPQAAGLYVGAWGVANFAGQAIGNVMSGLLRDFFLWLTGAPLVGYIAVFGMEIVGLLVAVWLFRSIEVADFRRQAETRLQDILSLAGD